MPQSHGKNAKIFCWDVAGACQDMSGDVNNTTMTWTKDNPDTTTYGNDTIQRMSGLRDVKVAITAIYNNGTNKAACVIGAHMAASSNILVKWFPVGQQSGCTFWTGCFLPSSYEEVGPVNAPIGLNFALEHSSGSLSASSV